MPLTSASRAMPISVVPAGWYKDPLGLPQLRWWNGTSWSTDVADPRPELLVAGGLGAHNFALANIG